MMLNHVAVHQDQLTLHLRPQRDHPGPFTPSHRRLQRCVRGCDPRLLSTAGVLGFREQAPFAATRLVRLPCYPLASAVVTPARQPSANNQVARRWVGRVRLRAVRNASIAPRTLAQRHPALLALRTADELCERQPQVLQHRHLRVIALHGPTRNFRTGYCSTNFIVGALCPLLEEIDFHVEWSNSRSPRHLRFWIRNGSAVRGSFRDHGLRSMPRPLHGSRGWYPAAEICVRELTNADFLGREAQGGGRVHEACRSSQEH